MRFGRLAAALVATVIATAPLAIGRPSAPECAAMSCCVARGTSCPMHVPSGQPSFQSCRTDSDVLPLAPRVTLSLPRRVDAGFERLPFRNIPELSASRTLWRPAEPAVPPPERSA